MAETPKATDVLAKAATQYATAKAGQMISNIGDRAAGNGKSKSTENGDGDGEEKQGFLGAAAQKLGEGASPIKAAVSGAGTAIKEGVTGLFKRKGGSKRPTNIVEDCFVGVTPDVAFAAWTEFQEFPSYMKGPENVSVGDETSEEDQEDQEDGQDPHEGQEMSWTAKIFVNRRSWKSNTVDYDPGKRLSWTSEGAKGTIDGTITFTAIGDNATLMLFVLEYRSKGPIEWIGNRWRTVGRRVRLDIKHFRRYVMRTEPEELPEPEEPAEGEEQEETDEADGQAEEPGTEDEESGEASQSDDDVEDADAGEEEGDAGDEGSGEAPEEASVDEDEEPEPAVRTRSRTRRRARA